MRVKIIFPRSFPGDGGNIGPSRNAFVEWTEKDFPFPGGHGEGGALGSSGQ